MEKPAARVMSKLINWSCRDTEEDLELKYLLINYYFKPYMFCDYRIII